MRGTSTARSRTSTPGTFARRSAWAFASRRRSDRSASSTAASWIGGRERPRASSSSRSRRRSRECPRRRRSQGLGGGRERRRRVWGNDLGEREPQVRAVPPETGAELFLRFALELPHALAAQVEALPDLLEGQFLPSEEAEPVPNDVELPLVEPVESGMDEAADLFQVDLLFLALGVRVRQ